MAITNINLGYVSGAKSFADSAAGSTANAVVASAATVYAITIDNTLNAAADTYFKLYDSAGAINVGTSVPDYVIRCRQGVKRTLVIPDGLYFANGIAEAALTTGGTAGSTGPTSNVPISIVYA